MPKGGGLFGLCTGRDSGDEEYENPTRQANGVAENAQTSGASSALGVVLPPGRDNLGKDKVTWATPSKTSKSTKPPKAPASSNAKSSNKVAPLVPLPAARSHVMSSSATSVAPLGTEHPPEILNYAAEDLSDLGFPVYVRETLQNQLPTSSSQSIAFIALETVPVETEQRPNVPSTSGRDNSYSYARRHNNKLVPVFTNASCEASFKINSYKEYAPVLRKLLKRDPLLTFAIQKALRYLKSGEPRSVNHVTPDPSGQTSSLFGMRITPCVWSEEDQLRPALLIEHNVPYNPAEIMPRLMRDYAVLSHVPAILTLIDFQGKVLYQNASSLAYMGDLLSVKYDKRLSEGLLKVLFTYDLHNLEDMLEDVLGGQEWQGVVQVPYSLRHYLIHANHNYYQDEYEARGGAGPRPTTVQDELEVQFQIGNSFTTRGLVRKKGVAGMNASFLVGKPGAAPPGSITAAGRPLPALPPGMLHDEAGALSGNELSSFTAENSGGQAEGSMAPRKFMTLLENQARAAHATRGSGNGAEEERRLSSPSGMGADGLGGGDDNFLQDDIYDEEQECFHEVHAIPLLDPVLDKQVVMLVQTDVTARVELENKLADLTEAQLSMLEQLFPRHIIEYMLARVPTKGERSMMDLANTHDQVMVLFCDVVGFTTMSKEVEPSQVMHFLNELYQIFDELVDEYGMYKLDIVGDCYIAIAGLIKEDQDGFVCVEEMDEDQVTSNAVRIMQFAKAMLRESQVVLMPHNSEPVVLRVGIHRGKLVSGLVGSKMPKFTLFGDTMNTASRMESTCRHGCVHVTDYFATLLPHEDWENTGGVEVKGKGLMQTKLWVPNTKRDDLLSLTGPGAIQDLRKDLSMGSFTSIKSRALTEMNSMRSKRWSDNGSDNPRGANPLMAILQNIRTKDSTRDDDEFEGIERTGGAGASGSSRPKSAFARMRANRASTTNTGGFGVSDHRRTSDVSGSMALTLGRRAAEKQTSIGGRSGGRQLSIEKRGLGRQPSNTQRRGMKKLVSISDRADVLGSGKHELDHDASYEPLEISDVP